MCRSQRGKAWPTPNRQGKKSQAQKTIVNPVPKTVLVDAYTANACLNCELKIGHSYSESILWFLIRAENVVSELSVTPFSPRTSLSCLSCFSVNTPARIFTDSFLLA